jgi:drug/metabolite transporter (DMT)-like permease
MNLSSFFIVAAGICWWLDGLLRSHIQWVSPLVVVTLEHAIGFLILLTVGWSHFSFPKLTQKAWLCLGGVALFSGLIGTYAFTWALANVHYTSFGVLFLLQKLQPLFAILAALIFLWERPQKSFYFLAGGALIASYFLSFGKSGFDMSFWSDAFRSAMASIIAAICWGSATVFSRYLSHQGYKARTMTAYRLWMVAILGTITLGTLALFWVNVFTIPTQIYQFSVTIVGIALLSGVIGTTFYYRGIRHTLAAKATIFELSFPLTGFLLDIFYRQKAPDIYQIIWGIALIFIMMTLVRTGNGEHKIQNTK